MPDCLCSQIRVYFLRPVLNLALYMLLVFSQVSLSEKAFVTLNAIPILMGILLCKEFVTRIHEGLSK